MPRLKPITLNAAVRAAALVIVAFGVALAGMPAATAQSPLQWRFSDVDRVVAVSDIHGAYSAFATILERAAISDDAGHWIGGATHLVIVGDVLDRGPDSRAALELIMQLQSEAPDAGGAVHFVLGNHEVMNLVGDLRYVSAEEFAAFAADETPQMRDAAFALLQAPDLPEAELQSQRTAFEARYPAGFFAHRAAFAPDGRYGAWLLQQPYLVAIDEFAFVHGGLARASASLPADGLNTTLQRDVTSYAIALQALIREGLLAYDTNFYDQPGELADWAERVAAGETFWPGASESAANIVTELSASLAFDADGPMWYRGNVACGTLIETDRLRATLTAIGAQHLVVGHTPTRDASIHSRLDHEIYRIDTGMLSEYYGGRAAALIVEGGRTFAVYENGDGPVEVEMQPREVGRRPTDMSLSELEQFLTTAEIIDVTDIDSRWRAVRLREGDRELAAVFSPDPGRGFRPDLAAYRLDRLLGLDMVPIVVQREIDGTAGTLQYFPPLTISEAERQEERLGAAAWCPLTDQFAAMYVFDALIGNTGRTLERLRYTTDSFELLLLGHDLSFPSGGEIPAHLREIEFELTPAWIAALRRVDEARIESEFADTLDRRRRRALLARVERLLATAGTQQAP